MSETINEKLPSLAKRRGRKMTKRYTTNDPIPEETLTQILECAKEGLTIRDIAARLGLTESTLYSWKARNNNNLAEKMQLAYLHGDIQRAEKKMRDLMALDMHKEDGTVNTKVVAIQQKEAEFIRSNVIEAQKYYSNRPQVNVQVNLPQPIIDLGNITEAKELDI